MEKSTLSVTEQKIAHEIGNRMWKARDKSKLTQDYLAEKLGIFRQTYSKYENGGTMPRILHLREFCKICNVSADTIIFGQDAPVNDDLEGLKTLLGRAVDDWQGTRSH